MKNYIVRAYVQKIFHGFQLDKMFFHEKKKEFFEEVPLRITKDNLPTVGNLIPKTGPLNIYLVLHYRFLTESKASKTTYMAL